MACAVSPFSSTKETTNYARLCRLLVDVGSQVLRETFDRILPPGSLYTVLTSAPVHATLQLLRKKRIINATQWGSLYPAIPGSVSSRDFDITLLMVLFRNICGLVEPATGWDSLPTVIDTTLEADVARIKFYRNTVYAHTNQASVDDSTFSSYWQDIRDTLVRLGGERFYAAAIDSLANDSMDPEIEQHYQELLRQWKKDEDSIKDKLDDAVAELNKKLNDLTAKVENYDHEKSQVKEPFNLEECQKQLRSIYDTMNKVKVIPWDQSSAVHIDEIFTQLSWLMDDRKPSGVTQEKLKDYTEIFKGRKHYPKPKRVLVYGRPGIGKTVFAQKTTFDWSKQKKELLRKFELVLLIKLRDVCDLQDIRAVLRASKLLARDGMISVDSLYDYILQNQEKVLLILDGYDEYSADKISPIRDIWERKQLRDCCVVMTTRRLKVDELRRPSDVQFEIKGFDSWSQVWKFARKLLKDDWDVKEFIEYLKEQNLKELAEIPLILLMLCLLWKERDRRGQPNSRADIYTQFIQTLLDHMTEKDADSKQFRKVDEYTEQLFKLGQFAFEALLQDSLFLHLSKLSDDILIEKLTKVGLLQVLNLSSLNPEKGVFFIHKSVQEFLAGRYLKDELLAKKSGNAACLSNVDTIEKVLKMTEVLKFACELSGEAANVILSHVGLISKKEGLTEYNFMRTPSLHDLSEEQRHFLTLSTHLFFCCSSSMRQDLFSVFASDLGGVLLLDSKQLHGIANEHLFIESTEVPNYIFFSDSKSPVQDYCDLISVVEDLNAIVVTCSGEMKASKFLKKYPVRPVNEIFLKKDDKVNLYFAQILRGMHEYSEPLYLSTEMLKELIASPESTQKMKKRVGDQPNEQDSRTSLCFAENKNSTSCSSRHCLSLVWNITVYHVEGEVMETLTEVLPFVASPRKITIYGKADEAYDAQTIETLVSRINFTDRLDTLDLYRISLTAKSAAVVARSLYHAPNLRKLDLSFNPVGEGVSVLARHLSCTPHLERLYLDYVKMAKKQVHDLTVAVRHTNISVLVSEYHDREGNPKPEHK